MKNASLTLNFIKNVTPKLVKAFSEVFVPSIVVASLLVFMISRDFLENDLSAWEALDIGFWLGPVVVASLQVLTLILFCLYILARGKRPFS